MNAMFSAHFLKQIQRWGHDHSLPGNEWQNSMRSADKRLWGHCFHYRDAHRETIIHTANNPIVTNGSLSTFDSSVSCLYFFETESRNTCLKKHSEGRLNIRSFGEERATRLYRRRKTRKRIEV
jgi:hypothetical protein